MSSKRITLMEMRGDKAWSSFQEGEFARGGLRAAIVNARLNASNTRFLNPRTTHVAVCVFPIAPEGPTRIVCAFPVEREGGAS